MREWAEIQILFEKNKTSKEIYILRTDYIFSFIIGMLCPLINAILAVYMDCQVITVVPSLVPSLAASLLALTNARLNWENYRSAAEFLKCEFTLFQVRAELYTKEQREEVYLHTIEAFM